MDYEWDDAKREANLRKHSIDFADVPALFEGYAVTTEDTRLPYDEPRFLTVGLLKGRAVVVAHTERGEKVRIISARKATKYEAISYFEQITNRLGAPRRAKRRRH